MRVASAAALVAISLIGVSSLAASQTSRVNLSAAERRSALTAIKDAFDKRYVFAERRPKIIARLDEAERSGRYEVDDPAAFADRVTQDLQAVSSDKHLVLKVDSAAYAAAVAPSDSDEGEELFWRRRAQRNHHGLSELRVLPGNVRYLKIAGFEWIRDETGRAYDDAMRFLKEGDAVIIDLRGNGGGSHSAVRYLVSHFLDGGILDMTFLEGSLPPEQSRTLEYLPAGRLPGIPLYVLIDGGSASAAEAFAYDVQQFKLGDLVGSKTVGAANNPELLPIAPAFVLGISTARPVHPVSNGNWEGIGVEPTVATDPSQAFDAAYLLALQRLAQKPGTRPENLAEYEWARLAVTARLHPVTIPTTKLRTLAGRYDRIDVAFRDGSLWLTRPNRPGGRLLPLTADGLFAVEGQDALRVHLSGKELRLLRADGGRPLVFSRN
ncbi:MAG: S41 family peptidase [Steroidobacteraceae bacterium]